MNETNELHIENASHILWAKGIVRRFSAGLGFSGKLLTELELCVSELATNLVVHKAKKGRLSFKALDEGGLCGIEIVALDEGPGIKDLPKALQGGASTAGSLGQGLASVQRFADEFEVYSDSQGTRIRICKYLEKSRGGISMPGFVVSVSVRTHPESPICGDGHVIHHNGSISLLGVIDGLGHGNLARKAAAGVEAYLVANHRKPLEQMPAELHRLLHSTRGAVVAIARIDETKNNLSFIGVGNIGARLWLSKDGKWVRLISMSGTLGVSLRTPRLFSYPWNKGSIFIMHTDGLKEHWELSSDEHSLSAAETSQLLMQRYWRRTDDATVMVAK